MGNNMQAENHQQYDVLVVGGGMVGASLAVALAQLPIRIAVVEAFAPGTDAQPSYDDRATAVAAVSQRIFTTLGVWPELAADATAIAQIHVSERGRFGVTRIDRDDYGAAALGQVIENRCIGTALWRALLATERIDLLCPARLKGLDNADAEGITVRVCDAAGEAHRLRARLVVGADGGNSVLRGLLSVDVHRADYGQSAVIANVTPQRGHHNVAYERFTASGPLACLPMSNGRCNVVWTCDPVRAEELLAGGDADFLSALQEEFGYRLGLFRKTGSRHAYPLQLCRAERIVGERWALIGNAAQSLHPVAGQGFNLGLRDAATLAEACAASLATHGDVGVRAGLAAYQSAREADQQRVVKFTDTLIKVFTSRVPALQAARGLGLASTLR